MTRPRTLRLCSACEEEDHANCGMQVWCECECDPELARIQEIEDKEDYGN